MQETLPFADPTFVMFAKMLVALVLGALIGTERAVLAKQSAGTRTFGLVSLGACLFVIISNYVNLTYMALIPVQPLQVAAAIITGIGFLGAGLIIFRGDSIHGTTTAAGLWIAAGVGIATAFGLYAVAVFATLLALIMFTGMWYAEQRFKIWFEGESHNTTSSGPNL